MDQKVKAFNLDGKDFLQGPVREELMQQLGPLSKQRKYSVHIVMDLMNLPAKPMEFFTSFKPYYFTLAGFPGGQMVKNLSAMWEI